MSQNFTLLWEKILRSSLWVVESKETRLVWITILAMKNSNGEVFSSVVGMADAAKVSLEECRAALTILMSPDANDTSKVEEGRRIREIAGGWQVVNHDMYRFSTDEKRTYWAQQKALQRQREKERLEALGQPPKKKTKPKSGPSGPLPGEARAVAALERGDESGFQQAIEDHQAHIQEPEIPELP